MTTRFLTEVSRPLKRWHIISSFHIRSNQSNLFKREHNLSSIIYSSIRTCYNDDHMTGHLLSWAISISGPTSAQSRLLVGFVCSISDSCGVARKDEQWFSGRRWRSDFAFLHVLRVFECCGDVMHVIWRHVVYVFSSLRLQRLLLTISVRLVACFDVVTLLFRSCSPASVMALIYWLSTPVYPHRVA